MGKKLSSYNFGATVKYKNWILEETGVGLSPRNALYHSVQNLLSFFSSYVFPLFLYI
jgi:hypothetical protein